MSAPHVVDNRGIYLDATGHFRQLDSGTPVADLLARVRIIGRAAGVRFGGVIVVLPDDDLAQAVTDLGKVRGVPVVLVARGALSNLLRQGVPGARSIGGNEIFDIRTRLQQAVRFV